MERGKRREAAGGRAAAAVTKEHKASTLVLRGINTTAILVSVEEDGRKTGNALQPAGRPL
jgi:hypothetical protein